MRRAEAPGLNPDGLPNRALRRADPAVAGALTLRAFQTWYAIASALIPGYVPKQPDEQKEAA
jgi:hypothetical protein